MAEVLVIVKSFIYASYAEFKIYTLEITSSTPT